MTEALRVRVRSLINAVVSERRHVCQVASSAAFASFNHAVQKITGSHGRSKAKRTSQL